MYIIIIVIILISIIIVIGIIIISIIVIIIYYYYYYIYCKYFVLVGKWGLHTHWNLLFWLFYDKKNIYWSLSFIQIFANTTGMAYSQYR